jgi:membrane-bound ClpP family serine protease
MENKAPIILAARAATTALGVAYYVSGWGRNALGEDPSIIPLITPMIDLRVADYVLARLERIRGDEVTVVLHTPGGCATSCVMIANAIGRFPRSTAVVPYMALSGGTLIALGAREIAIGRSAALSAVDPVLSGRRAKHIEAGDEDGLHATAREYEEAMRRHLRSTLRARLLATQGAEGVEKAMAVFMGHNAPHEWPIYAPELIDLGLPVRAAEARWSEYVDTRRGWWRFR